MPLVGMTVGPALYILYIFFDVLINATCISYTDIGTDMHVEIDIDTDMTQYVLSFS